MRAGRRSLLHSLPLSFFLFLSLSPPPSRSRSLTRSLSDPLPPKFKSCTLKSFDLKSWLEPGQSDYNPEENDIHGIFLPVFKGKVADLKTPKLLSVRTITHTRIRTHAHSRARAHIHKRTRTNTRLTDSGWVKFHEYQDSCPWQNTQRAASLSPYGVVMLCRLSTSRSLLQKSPTKIVALV